MSALDVDSVVMFAFIFILGFAMSILGLVEFASGIEKKKPPYLGLITCMLAGIIWVAFSLVWVASATVAMFVPFGNLFTAFGVVFVVLALACAGLILLYTAKGESKPDIEIRERGT